MVKIIWNRSDIDKIKSDLEKQHILVSTDPNEIPEDKIGLIIDEAHLDKVLPVLEKLSQQRALMMFQTAQGYMQVSAHEIIYLEAFGDEIFMHLEAESSQVIRQPLYQLQETLEPYHFVRIGKSFIVNMTKIRYIRSAFNAKLDLEMTDGTHLEVTRSFVKSFKDALGIRA